METGKIFSAMAAIMADIGAIGKDSKNKQQDFMFRGIDAVYNELHGYMAKHKVFSLPEVLENKSEERQSKSGGVLIYRILKMRYRFFADDGSSVEATVIGEGMDSGDKASNKAMAIAHKYCLLQAFCIPTKEGKDPDAESHEVTPHPPAPLSPRAAALPPHPGTPAPDKAAPPTMQAAKPRTQATHGTIKSVTPPAPDADEKHAFWLVEFTDGSKAGTYNKAMGESLALPGAVGVEIGYEYWLSAKGNRTFTTYTTEL